MISDEVLDSIQILKFFHDKCTSEKSIGMMQVYRVEELAKAIESILNFIEKQQKEIEYLKDINKKLEARKYMLNAITGEVTSIPIDNNYISKDKIKAIIEELQEDIKYSANPLSIDNSKFGIKVLQSLLEKE